MDTQHEHSKDAIGRIEDLPPSLLSPLDPSDALDLHRAINERRAQIENPELLRRLRAL